MPPRVPIQSLPYGRTLDVNGVLTNFVEVPIMSNRDERPTLTIIYEWICKTLLERRQSARRDLQTISFSCGGTIVSIVRLHLSLACMSRIYLTFSSLQRYDAIDRTTRSVLTSGGFSEVVADPLVVRES